MIKLYSAPRTRALRVVWLLEELDMPYELQAVEFRATSDAFFIQDTPTGKIPTLEDDGVVMCESGAIIEYLLERYGNGRLEPAKGSPDRAAYLQWLHFAEASAFPPLGIVVWLTRYRDDAAAHGELIADARRRALTALNFVEQGLDGRSYLAGDDFSAADIMMGFTLAAARLLQVLDDTRPRCSAYLGRLEARPAFRAAVGRIGGF